MIAVDTSAPMAIVLGEPEADSCIGALEAEGDLLIFAGTVQNLSSSLPGGTSERRWRA
jgi:ribonuclease VapC